jgi:hypothetical protein
MVRGKCFWPGHDCQPRHGAADETNGNSDKPAAHDSPQDLLNTPFSAPRDRNWILCNDFRGSRRCFRKGSH